MLTLMKPKVKPRILGLILGRNVAGPESPSSDFPPPTHLQAGGGGLSAAPLSTAVLRACTFEQKVYTKSGQYHSSTRAPFLTSTFWYIMPPALETESFAITTLDLVPNIARILNFYLLIDILITPCSIWNRWRSITTCHIERNKKS